MDNPGLTAPARWGEVNTTVAVDLALVPRSGAAGSFRLAHHLRGRAARL